MSKSVEKMNDYEKMIAALKIFNKYKDSEAYIGAEHDEITVGLEPEETSEEDAAMLDELGWFASGGTGWMMFT